MPNFKAKNYHKVVNNSQLRISLMGDLWRKKAQKRRQTEKYSIKCSLYQTLFVNFAKDKEHLLHLYVGTTNRIFTFCKAKRIPSRNKGDTSQPS